LVASCLDLWATIENKTVVEQKTIETPFEQKQTDLDSAQWLTSTAELEKHFCYAAAQMINPFKRHTHHQRL
jgi:uncharacterized membrane-anchored protein YhcB (DUF1043 family)